MHKKSQATQPTYCVIIAVVTVGGPVGAFFVLILVVVVVLVVLFYIALHLEVQLNLSPSPFPSPSMRLNNISFFFRVSSKIYDPIICVIVYCLRKNICPPSVPVTAGTILYVLHYI